MTEEGRNISEFNTSDAELEEGLRTAFVDGMHQSNLAYRPQFVSNDYQSGRKELHRGSIRKGTCFGTENCTGF